jgi:hypothetical protein
VSSSSGSFAIDNLRQLLPTPVSQGAVFHSAPGVRREKRPGDLTRGILPADLPRFGTLVRVLDDTIEALRSAALMADDASGHFPALYARVTDRIRQAAGSGEFADAEGMVEFATAFADWYLRPRAGVEPIPGSWRAAWDVAGDGRLLIVQHLLLGINAHVNHDLGQVVVELADQREDASVAGMRRDFDTVNAVLAATMPEVLRDLGRSSRWVNAAAAWGADRWFHFSLARAREQAWRFAERTHPLDGAGRQAAARELDQLVRVLAYMITRPVWPVGWLAAVGRRLEADDPRAITVDLLGHLA